MTEVSTEKICSTIKNKQIDLLPFSLDAQTAMVSCQSLGGQMHIPDSEDDLQMIDDFENDDPVLQTLVSKSCGKTKVIWASVYKVNGTWVHYNNHSKEVGAIGKRIDSDGNDLQKCAFYKTVLKTYGDIKCISKYCAFCTWEKKIQFTLRGLCEKTSIEDHFVLTNYLFFNGLFGNLTYYY